MKIKKMFVMALASVLAFSLAACGGTPQAASQAPATLSASVSEPPSSTSNTDNASEDELIGPNIDKAPADLSDLDAVTKIYVWPLIHCGRICSYSWETPADIAADDLIDVCAYNNLLDLPLNPEDETVYWGAEFVDGVAPAEQAEAAIQKHFDVTSEYLRTSESYRADTNTYQMYHGFGGGWAFIAMSAKQDGNQIVIGVGIQGPDDDLPKAEGILTVELVNGNTVKYISYKLDEEPLPENADELPPGADPIADLTEKVNQAPMGDESFGLPMLYNQLSYIASGETGTPYTGFASPDKISSTALYNFYLAMAQDDDAEKYLSADDSKYHIPIEAIKNTLDAYFEGYVFAPEQIVREPEGTCNYDEEAQEIIDSSFVGYGGPTWIEMDNADVQPNGDIVISAHGIDMDGNAVDRTEVIVVANTESGYQFKSYQITD